MEAGVIRYDMMRGWSMADGWWDERNIEKVKCQCKNERRAKRGKRKEKGKRKEEKGWQNREVWVRGKSVVYIIESSHSKEEEFLSVALFNSIDSPSSLIILIHLLHLVCKAKEAIFAHSSFARLLLTPTELNILAKRHNNTFFRVAPTPTLRPGSPSQPHLWSHISLPPDHIPLINTIEVAM